MLLELHTSYNPKKRVLVNFENILMIEESDKETFVHFYNSNRGFAVDEKYDVIVEMINNYRKECCSSTKRLEENNGKSQRAEH